MFEKMSNAFFSVPFFAVPRVTPLPGAALLSAQESEELLAEYALPRFPAMLRQDLNLLALGADVKNRYEVEAAIRLRISQMFPWWLYWIPGIVKPAQQSILEANMKHWRVLNALKHMRLPGYTFASRYISASLAYTLLYEAVQRHRCVFADSADALKTVCHLAQTATENEQILLHALPRDTLMGELPEFLQKQFETDNVDPEFFFSGETYRPLYALGKSMRRIRGNRSAVSRQERKATDLLELLLSHPGRSLILATSRKLDEFQAFVLEKLKEFLPDPLGDEMRYRAIREPSEIRNLRGSQLALHCLHQPLFWKKVMDRALQVREYGFIEEERPRAHILIDKSPSMLFFGNLFKAGGVLFNRLLLTLDDAADVSLQLFDEKVYQGINIEGPYEAERVMNLVRMAEFVGSGTSIDAALKSALEKVRKLPRRKGPDHVILVSDGRAEVTLKAAHLSLVRLHCFLLGGSNQTLKQLCKATGGVYQEAL